MNCAEEGPEADRVDAISGQVARKNPGSSRFIREKVENLLIVPKRIGQDRTGFFQLRLAELPNLHPMQLYRHCPSFWIIRITRPSLRIITTPDHPYKCRKVAPLPCDAGQSIFAPGGSELTVRSISISLSTTVEPFVSWHESRDVRNRAWRSHRRGSC